MGLRLEFTSTNMDPVNEESSSKNKEITCQICKKKRRIQRTETQRKTNAVSKAEPRGQKGKKPGASEIAETHEKNRTQGLLGEDQSKVFPWMNISRTNDDKHVQSQGKLFFLCTNLLDHSCLSGPITAINKKLQEYRNRQK